MFVCMYVWCTEDNVRMSIATVVDCLTVNLPEGLPLLLPPPGGGRGRAIMGELLLEDGRDFPGVSALVRGVFFTSADFPPS